MVFLFFFLLPFSKKLDFLQLFTFEAKIDEVKKEVAEVRGDLKQVLSNQMVLAVQNTSNNHVTIGSLQSPQAVAAVVEELSEPTAGLKPNAPATNAEVKDSPDADVSEEQKSSRPLDPVIARQGQGDMNWMLGRLSVPKQRRLLIKIKEEIEVELRRLLQHHHIDEYTPRPEFDTLMPIAIRDYSSLENYIKSFELFRDISISVEYGFDIPNSDLEFGLDIGRKLTNILRKLKPKRASD